MKGIPGVKMSLLEEFGVCSVSYDLPGFGESDPHPNRNLNSSALINLWWKNIITKAIIILNTKNTSNFKVRWKSLHYHWNFYQTPSRILKSSLRERERERNSHSHIDKHLRGTLVETLGNFGLCLSHIAKLGYGFWGEIAREDVWTENRDFFSKFLFLFL